jgi:hypothetical protein
MSIEPDELAAIAELKTMDRKQLDAVPFDVVHWQ